MQFIKERAIGLLIFVCIVSLFLGYFWRLHHETKQAERKYRMHVNQFLHEVFSPDTNIISHYEGYTFIKRKDGSVVIKRR